MEYDQRVIITFLLKEGADARDIAERLQAEFDEQVGCPISPYPNL
jgi:hypothetical protein